MDKLEFLFRLRNALRWTFSSDEIADILRDYESFFATGSEEGKTESAICDGFGHPSVIARDLAVALEKKKTRPLSARIIRRKVFSMALFVVGLTYCFGVYQSNNILRDSIIMLVGFSVIMWFSVGGTFRGSPPVSIADSKARKLLLPIGHIFLVSAVASCYFFLRYIESKWQSAIDVSSYGAALAIIIITLGSAAVLIGVLSIIGFYRLSPQFFTITTHAAGVVAHSFMAYSYLMRVDNPLVFGTSFMYILVIYGSSVVLTLLFALLISATSKRR